MSLGNPPSAAADTAGLPPDVGLDELEELAQDRLPPEVWSYAAGAAGSGATRRRNRAALDRLIFCPHVLRGVEERDTSVSFLGTSLSLPVMLAPVGSIARFGGQGALSAANAAAEAGTVGIVATMSSPPLEEVSARSGAVLYYQMYVRGDRRWIAEQLERLVEHGYRALCLTVDSAVEARWARTLRGKFHPEGGVPPNIRGASNDAAFHTRLTWEDLAWLCDVSPLPVIVKGVVRADDAQRALDCGAASLYVSNHGGRNLDSALAAVEALPAVVEVVAGRVPVLVDGGFVRGTDVVKAVALGATATLIGRLQCWALAVGGEAGLAQALHALRTEVSDVMAYLGVSRLDELSPDHLVREQALGMDRPAPVVNPVTRREDG